MPNIFEEIISVPTPHPISVRLEPAFNAIQALLLLYHAQEMSDADEWVLQTYQAMTPEERRRNALVAIGFHYVIIPDRSWPSFQAYLQNFRDTDPLALRKRMLDVYQNHECARDVDPSETIYDALASEETYLAFLSKRFPIFDPEIESEAYRYVIQPEAMKEMILAHLTGMWDKYLAPEWQRVKPVLKAVVDAFEGVDFRQMDALTAANWITGRDVSGQKWAQKMAEVRQVIFAPSVISGPYFGHYLSGDTLRVLYRARLPKNVEAGDTELSRAEILIRLNTLADDTRLRILQYISAHGETRSQTLIDEFNLSQPAASRHLSVLSGMGYLNERRCDGAKCYTINAERIEETARALSRYLLGKEGRRLPAAQLERS